MKTDAEVRLLRRKLMEDKTLEAAAAAAGMSEETARKYREGPMPSESKKPRHWRTHEDAFADIWEDDIEPLLKADEDGTRSAQAVFAELQRRYSWTVRRGGRCSGSSAIGARFLAPPRR